MNESLCRALVSAGLGEEDVAARLGVDTKTVRRWLEGRVPYRRHRWALASLLQVSDVDLWPQFRDGGGRPREVLAVYPRRDEIPAAMWLRLLGSARRDIAILDGSDSALVAVPGVLETVAAKAGVGVRVRVCLREPATVEPAGVAGAGEHDGGRAGAALGLFWPLRAADNVQIRLSRDEPYGGLCLADDEMLAVQHAYGIPPGRCPVLHLERCAGSELFGTYVDSFERVWQTSRPGAEGTGP